MPSYPIHFLSVQRNPDSFIFRLFLRYMDFVFLYKRILNINQKRNQRNHSKSSMLFLRQGYVCKVQQSLMFLQRRRWPSVGAMSDPIEVQRSVGSDRSQMQLFKDKLITECFTFLGCTRLLLPCRWDQGSLAHQMWR